VTSTAKLLKDAVALHQRGALADAMARYRQVLGAEPDNVDALILMATVLSQQGQFPLALQVAGRAAGLSPQHPGAHNLVGVALRETGQVPQAIEAFDRALGLQHDFADAWLNRGIATAALRRYDEAAESFARAAALAPGNALIHAHRGNALRAAGKPVPAISAYDSCLALAPGMAEVHCNRGLALKDIGRLPEALTSIDRAMALAPNNAAIPFNRALVLVGLDRREDALADFDRVVAALPDLAEAWYQRGMLNFALGRHEDALRDLDRALALRGDHIASHVNRSSVLIALDRLADAESGLDRAIAATPHIADLYADRAYARHLQNRFEEAFADTAKALELAPADPDVLHNVSMIELAHGRWAEGWPRFEARLRRPSLNLGFSAGNWPIWQGEPLTNAMLVLIGEQGIGDCIQLAGYVPELAARGFRVGLLTNEPLARLLATVPGVEAVFTDGAALAQAGPIRVLPMMSLPAVLGTTVDTVPKTVPFLRAEPASVAAYHERLGPDGFKIGIAWQGSPTFRFDRTRSIPLQAFAPLAEIPGVRLISLQKRPGAEQIDSMSFKDRVETPLDAGDLGPKALTDTAALMMNCDLVVSSCTMAVHLAGALGRPLHVALRRVPDWRWLVEREDTPWYPTAKLFRQTQDGDWDGVFARIATAVREKIKP
jgi:tetratricopeptide (TPR) repeat protein